MNTYRVIDKDNWPRRETFDFFQGFDNPCFNVSVMVEAEMLYQCAKDRKESFFLLALYAIHRAANAVPELRQRELDGRIVEYDAIAAMTPIMTAEERFCQIWCEYRPAYAEYAKEAAAMAERAKQGVTSVKKGHGEDFICASCLPWLHFTEFTQACHRFRQAAPILAWGKMKNGLVPVGVKFHHGFVDGLHASRFFAHLEENFANPDSLWNEG